jgi:hypothetical protein
VNIKRVLGAPIRAVRNTGRLLTLRKRGGEVLSILDRGKDDWDQRPAEARQTALYTTSSYWLDTLTAVRALALHLPVPSEWIRIMNLKSWKTSLGGVATILAVSVKVVNGEGIDAQGLAMLAAAIGLFFAKDHNVTGGTVQQ